MRVKLCESIWKILCKHIFSIELLLIFSKNNAFVGNDYYVFLLLFLSFLVIWKEVVIVVDIKEIVNVLEKG